MSKIDEYVIMLLELDIPEEQKISYLKVLNSIGKYSKQQLEELEDRVYTLNEKTLDEKDRLLYEINYLYAYYKSRNMDLTAVRKLYYKLRGIGQNEEEINKVKRNIIKLQLKNNLSTRFYNSYLDLLDEIEKQNRRKSQGTFNK